MTTEAIEKPHRVKRKLDIGAGTQEHQGAEWVTLDIVGTFRPDVLGDAHRLPFADGSLRAVKAHHVLEHIPRDYFVFHWEPGLPQCGLPDDHGGEQSLTILPGSRSYIEARKGLVDVMNEIWRVVEPGGSVWIEVPRFPAEEAIADPTHGSFFTPGTFDYFTRCDNHTADEAHRFSCRDDHRRMYGIKPWRITQREIVNYGRIIVVFMERLAE